jgi:hypothetical protein
METNRLVKHFPNGESVIVESIDREGGFIFISWGKDCTGTTPLLSDTRNNKGEYFYFNAEKIYFSEMFRR